MTNEERVTTIYKALKDKKMEWFVDGHDIHTPRSLVEEILTKINLTGNILVLFNIEFVVSLVYTFNIDPATIIFYSDHKYKNKFCKKLGVKYIETLETDMKFDVVLANPPYDAVLEENEQTKKIWINFIYSCIDQLVPGGHLGFICPPSWVLSNDAKLKKVRNKILELDLQVLKLGIQDQFPSKPGVQISYFTLINSSYLKSTQFYDVGKHTPVIINLHDGLPLSPEEQFVKTLIEKIQNSSQDKFKFILSGEKGKTLIAHGQLKVIVNYSKSFYSIKNVIDNNMPITTDPINNLQGYIPIKNITEGLNIKSFLHSKAIIYFANNYKRRGQTGFCDAVKRCAIPKFAIDKQWTDAEVYAALNLTVEEIEYIESNS